MSQSAKKQQIFENQRSHTRFKTDKNALAWFSFAERKEAFTQDIVGLVIDMSYKGCGAVVFDHKFEIDQYIYVQAGPIAPLLGKIVWLKSLDQNIYKIGVQFLE
jgi:hypothetical protein